MNKINKCIVVLGIVTIASLGSASYFFNKYQQIKANPQKIAQDEVKALVAKVGQLVVLPEGEDPTVATVSHPEKLKDQAFFAHAKKGDKVLIYAQAKRAYLYDPVANKLVDVAPINIGAATDKTGVAKTTPTPPKK